MYDNEYGIDDYAYLNQKKLFNFKIDTKKIIIFIIVSFIFILGTILLNNISFQTPYEKLEDKLVEEARKYVLANNLQSNNEYYIDSKKLNVNLDSNCYNVSGVFVNGNNYQAYLYCNDYETNLIDNNSSNIKLYGKNISFLKKGANYTESFYENINNVSVNINGHVGTEEGVYKLEYIILKNNTIIERLIRKIVVLDNEEIDNFYPNIKLNGDEIEYLKINESYIEKGSFASDIIDGIINDIKINGQVDTTKEGEYLLTYSVINSRGYARSITKKVIVIKNNKETTIYSIITPVELNNKEVKLFISVQGDDYSYTLLPNGEKNDSLTFSYNVYENGNYDFYIYNKDGSYKLKTITVSNIDKILPTATCNASIDGNKMTIIVNASDENGISGYNYIIDNKETGYGINSTYSTNSKSNNVSVNVKDLALNVKNVKCDVIVVSDDMTITPIPSVSFKCGTNVDAYNMVLANKVNKAGLKTREGVVAASNYLSMELGYKIEYWWAGKYDKVGLNSDWGCNKKIWATDGSGKYEYGNILPFGMDCTGFVKWAFINGGFDASLIPKSYMTTEKFGTVKPIVVKFSDNSPLINNLKKGDLLHAPNHMALVVGVDDTRIKLAQLTPSGLKVDLINKFTGKPITNTSSFTEYVLMDEFYRVYGN